MAFRVVDPSVSMFASKAQRLALACSLAEAELDGVEDDILVGHLLRKRRRRRGRRWWVRPWVKRRVRLGQYRRLMVELEHEDTAAFRNFLRVEPAMYHELVQRLTPRIQKQTTRMRQPLEPGLKVAITLRYLASGSDYHSLMYGFRVPHNTISIVIREVCQAILAEYAEEVMFCPVTPEEWRPVAEQFRTRWNFPHAVGAIDGKHIAITCPPGGGSTYYNYKGFYSVVLMALVDADYKFLWMEVGSQGSASDAQIFNECELKEALEDGSIGLPPPDPLPGDDQDTPYFLVGDDAFALKTWLMKPHSKRNMTNEERIFNYRLSRACRIVENAFGILANRFRCLLTTMRQRPKTVTTIVKAACCLHNLMRLRYPTLHQNLIDQEDQNHQVVGGSWRNEVQLAGLQHVGGNRLTRAAKEQRDYLTAYVNSSAGSVPWQQDMI